MQIEILPEMGLGLDSSQGLRCNRAGCNTNLPSLGSRTGWATYCSHLFCGPCGEATLQQGVCLACQADLSSTGRQELAKILRVNMAPSDMEKQVMLAGMCPSDILDVAKAGIEFYQHQQEMEVKLMSAKILKLGKKMEGARQFNEEVVNHYKSHITKLELEKEDLKRELSRQMQKTQFGAGPPQSLQLALQFSGQDQVAVDSPRMGQQADQIAIYEPDVEEIELEELEEEDFAPLPATNSRKETLQQVQQPPSGIQGSFGGVSSRSLQVRVEKVDMEHWGLNQSRSLGIGRSNQVARRPWVSDAQQWQQQGLTVRGAKRGHNMQGDHLHLRNGKKVRGRNLLTAPLLSPMRLF